MTSASELFYNRRARLGRGSADPELESAPHFHFHHHLHHYNQQQQQQQPYQSGRRNQSERRGSGYGSQSGIRRQGLDGCLPLRRSAQSRMPGLRLSFSEREPVEFNEGSSQFSPANSSVADGISSPSNGPRVTCGDRLPGAVLQARERLLQRLRGLAVSERRSRRPSLHVNINSYSPDDYRLADAGDWDWVTDVSQRLDFNRESAIRSVFPSEQLTILPEQSKKPPGLSQEALNCLPTEIFDETQCSRENTDDSVSWDCSICLESFSKGEELARLRCKHRFHLACLDHWAQICGDCPCCRRNIL